MNFILCLFIAFSLNAQEGTGFQEIDPKKDAVILKRIEAEKLLKKMVEKKKAEAAARAAEEKRKAQLLKDYEENVKKEKLARLELQKKEREEQNKLREQQKKDEEQKRLAAEQIKKDKQQKEYESSINKQLAERNKKEIPVKRKFTWLETVMLKQKILEEAKKSMERDHGTPEERRISLKAAENREQENAQNLREAEERRRIAFSSTHKENKRASHCIFPGNPIFPQGMKVVAVGGYEGTYPGGRGFRHHPMTEVTINVVGSGPVAVLILTYEPVKWKIKSAGAEIAAVAVIGYHRQEIEGVGEIPKLISSYEGSNYICPYREYPSEHDVPFNDRSERRLKEYSTELFGKEPENSIQDYTLPPEVTVKAD